MSPTQQPATRARPPQSRAEPRTLGRGRATPVWSPCVCAKSRWPVSTARSQLPQTAGEPAGIGSRLPDSLDTKPQSLELSSTLHSGVCRHSVEVPSGPDVLGCVLSSSLKIPPTQARLNYLLVYPKPSTNMNSNSCTILHLDPKSII